MNNLSVLRTALFHHLLIPALFTVALTLKYRFGKIGVMLETLAIFHRGRAGDNTSIDTGDQAIGTQPVGAVNGKITLAYRIDTFNIGLLIFVYPQSAHGVMHAGEYAHRY